MAIENTATHFMFRRLVVDAERRKRIRLSPLIESYLAQLLMERISDTEVTCFRVADHISKAYETTGLAWRRAYYVDGAEACLFIVGLFPEVCMRRNVPITFYGHWGKQMYSLAANREQTDVKYRAMILEDQFFPMAQTLRAIRDERKEVCTQLT